MIEKLKRNSKITKQFFVSFLSLILLFASSNVFAQTKTASTGNWNTAATWSPLGVPAATDSVIIPNGITVTVNMTDAQCSSIQINNNGNSTAILTFASTGSPKLTVNGAVVVGSISNANREGTITFTKEINCLSHYN